jgi:hypothetical protein
MPGMKCTPGMDGASDVTGPAKLVREYGDPSEPEHKMYCLTADIVYKITNPVKE